MKHVLVMRHAKSSHDDPGLDDHDRPLHRRGKRDAPRMGRLLREAGLVPDAILSSTAVRAIRTARAVAKETGFSGEVRASRALYGAGPATCLAALRALDDAVDRALLVAHNPGVEDLVALLTGREEGMPTAAIAVLELPVRRWTDLRRGTRARLEALWAPKGLAR